MRVAHVAVVTPHRAGLYETTRDLVAAERRAGLDARIIDPIKEPEITEDRGVPIVGPGFAKECQVLVNHSGLSKELNRLALPVIHVLHGRPYSSFLLEQQEKIAVYSYLNRIRNDPRFKLFVTFWPEYLPYWSTLLPSDRLHAVAAPVDLERWTPQGPTGYDFQGHKGRINMVCASMWRQDDPPYHIIHAFRLFAARTPGARLHVYGAPGKGTAWEILKRVLQADGILGEVVGIVMGLDNVYRAADVAIAPHRIATRSVREPLACGCNVVMAPGNNYTPFQADPEDLEAYAAQIGRAVRERAENRRTAELLFDPALTAAQFIPLLEQVCSE
jgi:glycosyltransferase involved in cell wall biosynthesis